MGSSFSSMFRRTGASRTRPRRVFSGGIRCARIGAKRHAERGGGHLKAIIWTMVLVAFIYVAAMVLPVLVNEYQFQDSLQDIARFASLNRKSNDQIRQTVLDEAKKEDLPVEAE